MIEATDLVKSYGRSRPAVDGVSFSLQPGMITGLLGPNGAGKTTIMKMLTGYHHPDSGHILVGGQSLQDDPVAAKSRLGYLPENAPLYPELTVREYLEFIRDIRIGKGHTPTGRNARQAMAHAVEACGLKEVWNRPVDTLSKGFRQRVGLAQAIIHDPEILILDEPTNGLDPRQILEIRALIRELGHSRTILLSTHILGEVEAVCDQVLILDRGRVKARGSIADIGRALQGGPVCRITLPGDPGPLVALLETRRPDLSVHATGPEGEDLAGMEIRGTAGMAPVELQVQVFDLAVEAGVRLASLQAVREGLEGIFIHLTDDGEEGQ